MTYRIVGDRGEATAVNFVEPHLDDRVVVTTAAGQRVEELGRRSSYTFQLEALAAHLREGAPLPIETNDAVEMMQLIDDCYLAAGFHHDPARSGTQRKEGWDEPLSLIMALLIVPRRKRTHDFATLGWRQSQAARRPRRVIWRFTAASTLRIPASRKPRWRLVAMPPLAAG